MIARSRRLLDLARYFADLAELGQFDASSATPEEWTVVHVMLQEKRREQYRIMQSGMMRIVHEKQAAGGG